MASVISFGIIMIFLVMVNGNNHVHYKFEYGVNDPHTKDNKNHFEYRNGDHVMGEYTLMEADGTQRIVKYKSGPKSGFEAVVERVGHAQHDDGKGTSYVGATHWGNQNGY